MLRWAYKPSKAFDKLVVSLLGSALDDIDEENGFPGDIWVNDEDFFECSCLFPDINIFRRECNRLIEAVKSDRLYMPTEYHFYLLWQVMEHYSEIDEDYYCEHKDPNLKWFDMDDDEIAGLDLDCDDIEATEYALKLCESPKEAFNHISGYFWDTDFHFDPSVFNKMSGDIKAQMTISEGTFGVVNRLVPIDKELEMEDYTEIDTEKKRDR